jgi:hypothetical protein
MEIQSTKYFLWRKKKATYIHTYTEIKKEKRVSGDIKGHLINIVACCLKK